MKRRSLLKSLSWSAAHAAIPFSVAGCFGSATSSPLKEENKADSKLFTVYIHGLGQSAGKNTLKATWDNALFGTSPNKNTSMAYWGTTPPGANASFLQATSTLKKEDAERLLRLYERLSGEKIIPDAEAQIIPLPPPIRKRLTKAVTQRFIQDTYDFLFVKERRDFMVKKLLDAIPRHRPYNLIAHSQGTLIAYHAIRNHDMGQLNHLTTLGSPLGLPEIHDFFREWFADGLTIPSRPVKWVNVFDNSDIVSWNETLAGVYTPRGKIQDIHRDGLNLSSSNPHSITGYLKSPEVQALFGNPASRAGS